MTTNQPDALLSRILQFDKTPRTEILDQEASIISYEFGRWVVEGLFAAGSQVTISPIRLAVYATPDELVPVMDRLPPPLLPTSTELNEIRGLLGQASDLLARVAAGVEVASQDDVDSALWRLVDATGVLSTIATPGALGTVSNPTGRGYAITGGSHHNPGERRRTY